MDAKHALQRVRTSTIVSKQYSTRLEERRKSKIIEEQKTCDCNDVVKKSNDAYHSDGAVSSGARLFNLRHQHLLGKFKN